MCHIQRAAVSSRCIGASHGDCLYEIHSLQACFALKRPALRLITAFFCLVQIRISHARLVSQVYLDAIGIVGFKLLSRLSERRRDADNQHVSGDCDPNELART